MSFDEVGLDYIIASCFVLSCVLKEETNFDSLGFMSLFMLSFARSLGSLLPKLANSSVVLRDSGFWVVLLRLFLILLISYFGHFLPSFRPCKDYFKSSDVCCFKIFGLSFSLKICVSA